MAKQKTDMMMNMWQRNRHICENYSPRLGGEQADCPSMKFYHWGALTGFISLLEDERELHERIVE